MKPMRPSLILKAANEEDPTILPTVGAQWKASLSVDQILAKLAPQVTRAIKRHVSHTETGIPYLSEAGKRAAMIEIRRIVEREEPKLVNVFMKSCEHVAKVTQMDAESAGGSS